MDAKKNASKVFQIITTRPVAVLCVVAAFLVFGWVSFGKLKTTLMPDLEYPQLTVRTEYPAAAPEDVEDKVSKVIEERLGNVSGLVNRSSISRAETSDVVLEFAWGTDMVEATADVRDRIDRIGFGQDDVDRPQILRYDPSQDPTMRLMLYATDANVSLLELRSYAEDILKPELQKIDGVAAVQVSGGQERRVRVALSEYELNRHNLSAGDVQSRISAARIDTSAGIISLSGLDVILRVVSDWEALDVLKNLEIQNPGEGRVLLKEVATIDIEPDDRKTITRFASDDTEYVAREGVLLEVLKEGDANIVETAKSVWKALYGDEIWQQARNKRGEGIEVKRTKTAAPSSMGGGRRGRGRGGGGGGGSSLGAQPGLLSKLPTGMNMRVLSDQSFFIEDAVNDVSSSAVLGALLAVVVLFLFLRSVKSTVLIAASIPLSIITTFIPVQTVGVTLNLMSLGGLALGVGMLVDNSVVVIESIARCREEGDDPVQAAVRGISEVGGAILASTMTTVAVFAPIIFVEGIAGQVFRDLSLTVVFSLLASLIVAQFVVPALAGLSSGVHDGKPFPITRKFVGFMVPAKDQRKGLRLVGWVFSRLLQFPLWLVAMPFVALMDLFVWVGRGVWRVVSFVLGWVFKPVSWLFEIAWKAVDNTYPQILRVALAQPLLVLGVTVVAALASLFLARGLDTELLPRFTQEEFYADVNAPEGTPIETTDNEMALLARLLSEDPDFRDNVSHVSIETGGEDSGDARRRGPNRSRMVVTLNPDKRADEITGPVQTSVRSATDESTLFQQSLEFDEPSLVKIETGLRIEVRGDDNAMLSRVATRIENALRELKSDDGKPLLDDIQSSLGAGRPQVQLTFDREQLMRFGLTPQVVTNELKNKIGGAVSSTFYSGGKDLDVQLELALTDKNSLARVKEIDVAPGAALVRLREVLSNEGRDLSVIEGPREIRRVGNQRAVVITGVPQGAALSSAMEQVDAVIHGPDIDLESTDVRFAGQALDMEKSITSLMLALGLAVFLVYVVMAVQFESIIDPLIIMVAVPFAGIGVVAALIVTGRPVSIMVLLGAIVLAGVVVNNAIVLISYARILVDRGKSPKQAALEAGRVRLRPIAITTLTTVLGLVPLTGWLDPFLPLAHGVFQAIDQPLINAGVFGEVASTTPVIGGWNISLSNGLALLSGGGEGAEVRKPLAVTVIAGLVFSTFLTLVVIPTLWSWVHSRRKASPATDA